MEKHIPESKVKLILYYQKNKELIHDLVRIGDPYIKAMALSIISEVEESLEQK